MKMQVGLVGSEIRSVTNRFVIDVPDGTTTDDIAALGSEFLNDILECPEWDFQGNEEFELDGVTSVEHLDDSEDADVRFFRSKDGKLVPSKVHQCDSKNIRLRVWIANEHGCEFNHCHIDVPAEDLNDCDIDDLDAVEDAKKELIDDYVDTLITGVDKPRCEDRKEGKQ